MAPSDLVKGSFALRKARIGIAPLDLPEPLQGHREEHSKLLAAQSYSDFTIICGGERLQVHRVVLGTRSQYFDNLFNGQFKEKHTGEIRFDDEDPNTIRAMVEYMYTLSLPEGFRMSYLFQGDETERSPWNCLPLKEALDWHQKRTLNLAAIAIAAEKI
ncbi:hypothetical protein NA57DRAFT_54023 [Rhizodiscina lignyota]|uniref:BTB domain-containing protein n=1 Tax=Rhizodiscina lignyota TaxID=1504668 RepID=A0A9P4IPD5_9PEZI|nr:hypothetical protein NA57DRAFT_54023 [Rhizodiscina lignyota]